MAFVDWMCMLTSTPYSRITPVLYCFYISIQEPSILGRGNRKINFILNIIIFDFVMHVADGPTYIFQIMVTDAMLCWEMCSIWISTFDISVILYYNIENASISKLARFGEIVSYWLVSRVCVGSYFSMLLFFLFFCLSFGMIDNDVMVDNEKIEKAIRNAQFGFC